MNMRYFNDMCNGYNAYLAFYGYDKISAAEVIDKWKTFPVDRKQDCPCYDLGRVAAASHVLEDEETFKAAIEEYNRRQA